MSTCCPPRRREDSQLILYRVLVKMAKSKNHTAHNQNKKGALGDSFDGMEDTTKEEKADAVLV